MFFFEFSLSTAGFLMFGNCRFLEIEGMLLLYFLARFSMTSHVK